jgi:hypothetical protein
VLGLSALLQLPIAELPAPLRDSFDTILIKLVEICANLQAQKQQAAENAEAEEDEDEEDEEGEDGEEDEDGEDEEDGEANGGEDGEDEDFIGGDDDEDAIDPEDVAYIKEMNRMRREIAEQQFRMGAGEELDEDLEDDDEEDFVSPLDTVDEVRRSVCFPST